MAGIQIIETRPYPQPIPVAVAVLIPVAGMQPKQPAMGAMVDLEVSRPGGGLG